MQKIRINELVDFRRKITDSARKNFAYKLKSRTPKEVVEESENKKGGDYWITSTSCISNVFKHNDINLYDVKIDELAAKSSAAEDKLVKSMFQRNIDILNSFKDFHINDLRPSKILKFESVQRVHKIHYIEDLPLYINPSLLFSHERKGKNELGAIWLIARVNGFKKDELGIFCDILHRFLTKNYSNNYQISDDLCIAIDTFNGQKIVYQELVNDGIPSLLDRTLTEIKKLM